MSMKVRKVSKGIYPVAYSFATSDGSLNAVFESLVFEIMF